MTLFDPGLQPERTELAWRRTALALGAGSLVAFRLLPATFGNPVWAFGGVAGLAVAAGFWIAARQRYSAVNAVLSRDGDRGMLPGALPIAALATVVLLIGLSSLAVVIIGAA
ncbi:DUF202 domain-containing protein [Microbacterium sp. Be9]|uniref:DUF202 domain-containing protein n=1 Tax=Microbacterium sp. Be9 TaxID=2720211 RepID=UPI001424235D|nr:DUF202 domain-containing protein [Microbacterium sp. Be9]NIG66788.1 DUF202 domain-containing protein [Microbacterium sp. Be9]